MGLQRVGHDGATSLSFTFQSPSEGYTPTLNTRPQCTTSFGDVLLCSGISILINFLTFERKPVFFFLISKRHLSLMIKAWDSGASLVAQG